MTGIAVSKIRDYTGHREPVYTLCSTGENESFFSGGAEGLLVKWDRNSGSGNGVLKTNAPIYALKIIPERDLLLVGLSDGGIHFVELSTLKILRSPKIHEGAVFDFLPLADSDFLLASSGDGTLSVWDLGTFQSENRISVSGKSIRTLAMNGTGNQIVAGASDNHIYLFDSELKLRKKWLAHGLSVFRTAFSPENGLLLSTGRDAHIKAWDPFQNFLEIESIPAHNYAVNDLVFAPETGRFVTGSMDKSIKIWDGNQQKLLKVVDWARHQGHKNGINRLLFLENRLLSCGDDRLIMEWEIEG